MADSKLPRALDCVLLLLLMCWVLGCHGDKSCFPVQEGESCTLTCEGTDHNAYRKYFWEVRNSTSPPVATSNGNSSFTSDKRYQANFTSTDQKFKFSLTIQNITAADRGAAYECMCYDKYDDKSETIIKTVLSDIYHSPESPTCRAEIFEFVYINITCNTSNVYPDIACQLEYKDDTGPITPFPMEYVPGPLRDKYRSASCSIIVPATKPGINEYLVKMSPDFRNQKIPTLVEDGQRNLAINVTIDSTPKIVIDKMSDVNSCLGEQDVVNLTCRWYWFPPNTRFLWRIGNKKFESDGCPSRESGNSHYNTSVCTHNFTLTEFDKKSVVTCEAYSTDLDGRNSFNDTLRQLEIRRPPDRYPRFVLYPDGVLQGSRVRMDPGEQVNISCEVEGGTPEVSEVEVVCRTSNKTHVLYNVSQAGNSVTFNVTASPDLCGARCKCSALHVTQCYNLTNSFTFWSSLYGNPRGAAWEGVNAKYIAVYIIAVGIGFIAIGLLGGAFLYLCKKWEKLYNYTYESSRMSLTSAGYSVPRDLTGDEPCLTGYKRRTNSHDESAAFLIQPEPGSTMPLPSRTPKRKPPPVPNTTYDGSGEYLEPITLHMFTADANGMSKEDPTDFDVTRPILEAAKEGWIEKSPKKLPKERKLSQLSRTTQQTADSESPNSAVWNGPSFTLGDITVDTSRTTPENRSSSKRRPPPPPCGLKKTKDVQDGGLGESPAVFGAIPGGGKISWAPKLKSSMSLPPPPPCKFRPRSLDELLALRRQLPVIQEDQTRKGEGNIRHTPQGLQDTFSHDGDIRKKALKRSLSTPIRTINTSIEQENRLNEDRERMGVTNSTASHNNDLMVTTVSGKQHMPLSIFIPNVPVDACSDVAKESNNPVSSVPDTARSRSTAGLKSNAPLSDKAGITNTADGTTHFQTCWSGRDFPIAGQHTQDDVTADGAAKSTMDQTQETKPPIPPRRFPSVSDDDVSSLYAVPSRLKSRSPESSDSDKPRGQIRLRTPPCVLRTQSITIPADTSPLYTSLIGSSADLEYCSIRSVDSKDDDPLYSEVK